jgi:hypothetical protein
MYYREIQTPVDSNQRRKIFVVNTKAVLGLSAWPGNPAVRYEFEQLLGLPPMGAKWDLDRPFRVWKDATGAYRTEGVSTCMLVAAGIMRLSGVKCEAFEKHYIPGAIPSTLHDLSDFAGATLLTGEPQPGEAVAIGEGLATHMFTVFNIVGSNHHCCNGGAVEDGKKGFLQCIKPSVKKWPYPYQYRIDCTKLPMRPTCKVPDNGQGSDFISGIGLVAAIGALGLGAYMLRKG